MHERGFVLDRLPKLVSKDRSNQIAPEHFRKSRPPCVPTVSLAMSHLKLSEAFLSLILGTVAFQVAADDLKNAGKIAPAAVQSPRWDVAQTAGTTPQTIKQTPTLGDSALELELSSKFGITGTELQILASELRSRLLTKETINRYEAGAAAAQYAALSDAIYRDESLVDFDKDGKADWKLDPQLNRKDAFTGFHCAVYVHTSRKEAVIAFEGTTPPDPGYLSTLSQFLIDLLNDVAGAALSDPQTVRAEALVIEALAKYGKDHRIIVTGHSLGGRLAQIVAASRALEAYTFNPAAVSKVTQKIVGPSNPSRITNILMVSDVVNPVSKLSPTEQSRLGSDLGRRVEFYFPWSGFLREHSIATVAQRLSGVRRVYEDKIKPMLASQQMPGPAAASSQSAAKSSGGMVHTYQWSSDGGLGELGVDEKGCRRHPTNEIYNKRIQELGRLALRKANPCLTTAYLEADYNAGGNEVHAGIDFRAENNIDKVYAIADGEIAVGSSFDGKTHSTLIVETPDKRYKVLYLHMSSLDPQIQEGTNVKVGKTVKAGDPLGVAGDVGLGPGGSGPHLHIELWRAPAPQYDQARSLAAVNGNCPASDWSNKKGLCDAGTIADRTLDPAGLPKLDEEKTAEAKLPPLPLVVPSSKVGHPYVDSGSWELRKPAKLFSAAKTSSAVIRVLPEGTKVEAQQIEFHVLRYRLSEAVRATSVEVTNVVDWKSIKLTLRQGDVIAEFLYLGDEGAQNVIFRGRVFVFDDVSVSEPRKLNPFYDTVVWARVKTKEGAVGWLQDPDAQGMSRYD